MRIPDTSYDRRLGVYAVFVAFPRPRAIELKLLLETYEGAAVVRSLEPDRGGEEIRQVLLVAPDFRAVVEGALSEFEREVPLRLLDAAREWKEALRSQLLGELEDLEGLAK